jgi:hypothetical protein
MPIEFDSIDSLSINEITDEARTDVRNLIVFRLLFGINTTEKNILINQDHTIRGCIETSLNRRSGAKITPKMIKRWLDDYIDSDFPITDLQRILSSTTLVILQREMTQLIESIDMNYIWIVTTVLCKIRNLLGMRESSSNKFLN